MCGVNGALASNIEFPTPQFQHHVGRHDVYVVRFHVGVVRRREHGKRRAPADDVWKQAYPAVGKVGYEHEGHAWLARHGLKKQLQSFNTACRGADANYGKFLGHRGTEGKASTSSD